jgi:DNA-binding CsgD family transcriptional regulator
VSDWIVELVRGEGDAKLANGRLLRAAERLHGFGAWAWDTGADRFAFSEGATRILGEPADRSLRATLQRAHPDDRGRAAAIFERARRGEPGGEVQWRIVLENGTVRFLHAVIVGALGQADARVLYGLLRDLTAVRALEREAAAHVAVSGVLRAWEGLDGDGRRLLEALSRALGFTQASLWVPAGEELEPRLWWSDGEDGALARWLHGRLIPVGRGLAGTAWERREPVVLGQAPAGGCPFRDYCERHRLRGAAALPLIGRGRVLAVIAMTGPVELELTDRLRGALLGIAHEVGAFLAPRVGELVRSPLSARELELLALAAEGLSGPQIARRLNLSPSTVKTHFENIYAKYGVPDRVAAVAKAIRAGLIS